MPDTAGTLPLQLRVEDKASATVSGIVEGDADGIWVVNGGKATLNGDNVPERKGNDTNPGGKEGVVIGL